LIVRDALADQRRDFFMNLGAYPPTAPGAARLTFVNGELITLQRPQRVRTVPRGMNNWHHYYEQL
jgi:hypothetical protein